jgi:integral membrane protein (TIGR00529 family)
VLKRMMDAVVNVARDRRIAMAVLPAVIGLLPSAGGAAFSAPLVQEAAADEDIRPEQKTFINYWFRHVWEYISPLYPGVVLVVAITNVPIDKFILSQLPLTIASIVVGALLGFRGVAVARIEGKRDRHEFKTLCVTLIPIIASILLVVVFKLPLAIAMTMVVVALLLFYRYSPKEFAIALQESLSFNVIFMVIGIMAFKGMLEATGAIVALPAFFHQSGLPMGVVLFALPFIVGLLTGFSAGYVGATFPIIAAMLGPNPDLGSITFAYASGFAGVMLSPTHLCYILTLKYFKADMAGSYRYLYLPVLVVVLVGLIRLWI